MISLLMLISTVPALVANVFEHFFTSFRIAERHHSHHDTYVVPPLFTRGIALCLLVTAFVGDLTAIMCLMGVYSANPVTVLGFFDGACLALFVAWYVLCRYKVQIFDAGADGRAEEGAPQARAVVIRPLVGKRKVVYVDQITHMNWFGVRKTSGYRDLMIWENERRKTHIWAIVDLEQILMHIDRFDAFPQAGEEAPDLF